MKRSKKAAKGAARRNEGFKPEPPRGGVGGRWTEPAERRTGQIRGQEPHGQGARQMSRDPKDGGRPRGRRR